MSIDINTLLLSSWCSFLNEKNIHIELEGGIYIHHIDELKP